MAMANVRSILCLCPSIGIAYFSMRRLKGVARKALRETASRAGCQVHALQVGADHVHIFVGLHPDCSVSELIRLFKCNSA